MLKGKHAVKRQGMTWKTVKCGKMTMLNFCERQMSSSALSSMSPALPDEPLLRSFDRLKAGHTGTNQLTITAPNLSFPGLQVGNQRHRTNDSEGGVIETRSFKRQR